MVLRKTDIERHYMGSQNHKIRISSFSILNLV